MNWGIIGLGGIARDFATQMNEIGAIYGVASRDPQRTAQFRQEFHAKHAYASYEELAADPNINNVYIATVNSQHLKDIRLCLDAGKNVLCEKAIWRDYAETKAMYDLAAQKHLVLAEAMTIYHMPLYRKLQALIAEGKIGHVKMIRADIGSLMPLDESNRFFAKALGGGAMQDLGTYDLSFIRWFSGETLGHPVYTMQKASTGVDEMWTIAMATDDGVLANANMAFRADMPHRGLITGDGGYIEVPGFLRADTATLVGPDGQSQTIKAGDSDQAFAYEIKDFEECVQEPGSGLAHRRETLDVIRLIDQLLTAAQA